MRQAVATQKRQAAGCSPHCLCFVLLEVPRRGEPLRPANRRLPAGFMFRRQPGGGWRKTFGMRAMDDEKPKMPGILTENIRNPALVIAFLQGFRPGKPSPLPTACTLNGKKGRKLEELRACQGDEEVFIYWDQGTSLRKDVVYNVIAFWNNREPWEDYDFCIFPESLAWCIGFTHNDYCVLVEARNLAEPDASSIAAPPHR